MISCLVSEIIITYSCHFAPRTAFVEIPHTCVCTVLHREINETEDSNINKFFIRVTQHLPPPTLVFFGSHETSPIMIRQVRTRGDTVLVKSREMTGGDGVKTTENKIHLPLCIEV